MHFTPAVALIATATLGSRISAWCNLHRNGTMKDCSWRAESYQTCSRSRPSTACECSPGAEECSRRRSEEDLRGTHLLPHIRRARSGIPHGRCDSRALGRRWRPAHRHRTIAARRDAGLIVRVPGSDANIPPIVFSAHMDVVNARPEDWERNPFEMIEDRGAVLPTTKLASRR